MSDQFDPEIMDAARKIAARCNAIGLCSACGSTWSTDEYDPEDEDSMSELVSAARRIIEDDESLDRFDDDGGLRHALVGALAGARAEKSCAH
jgi:hypothetical protein